ncbi:type III polyketide synthase [Caldalkalibacillus mannanilyticus]|uniref:type III polyketide synthase n=1 Tax=Caldalkalibacillus mannanilyticus TaxID=1418 RepID=UPI00046A8FC7|nr:3-oxoacyl-[acyl-carrier-protein] synthase III C-terminal domain-containing protein [Caldalkalibacillus mannanilyticus]
MPKILSVGTYSPPYQVKQEVAVEFAKEMFQESYDDIERMLQVFVNGQIEKRHFAAPLDWFYVQKTFQEKNDLYISKAVEYGGKAIEACLNSTQFLKKNIPYEQIDAIFFISTSGLSTPSIEARIMNHYPFRLDTKRIPIWGLGCAGGASGLSRAYEYCLAFPESTVLVLCVELCSLTFQQQDKSKSNLVGTSLFADGVAAVVMCGDKVRGEERSSLPSVPVILGTQSTLLPNSEDVMGWNVQNEGLHVVFSRSIPHLVRKWLGQNVEGFLDKYSLDVRDIDVFIAHPGGKKVIDAYQGALSIPQEKMKYAEEVLKEFGNMSSATVLYVLERVLLNGREAGELGMISALGPGFSSELLLVQWT